MYNPKSFKLYQGFFKGDIGYDEPEFLPIGSKNSIRRQYRNIPGLKCYYFLDKSEKLTIRVTNPGFIQRLFAKKAGTFYEDSPHLTSKSVSEYKKIKEELTKIKADNQSFEESLYEHNERNNLKK